MSKTFQTPYLIYPWIPEPLRVCLNSHCATVYRRFKLACSRSDLLWDLVGQCADVKSKKYWSVDRNERTPPIILVYHHLIDEVHCARSHRCVHRCTSVTMKNKKILWSLRIQRWKPDDGFRPWLFPLKHISYLVEQQKVMLTVHQSAPQWEPPTLSVFLPWARESITPLYRCVLPRYAGVPHVPHPTADGMRRRPAVDWYVIDMTLLKKIIKNNIRGMCRWE